MSNVTFDPQRGIYFTSAPSDSLPFGGYEVTYDPMTGDFYCACPAFQFSRDRHCKHISRVGGTLNDYVDSLDRPGFEVEAPAPHWPSDDTTENPRHEWPSPVTTEAARFEASFNEGAWKVLEADTVSWLLDTVRAGDTVHLRRLP